MPTMRKDVAHNVAVYPIINAAAKTATTTSSSVDLTTMDEGEAIAVLLTVGAWTDGTHTPKIQDSPDNSVWSDYTPAIGVSNTGTATTSNGGFVAISGTGQQNQTQLVNYTGGQRYIRVVVTVSGATTGAIYGAYVVQGAIRKLAAF